MTEEYAASRYEEACGLLPLRLRTAAMALPMVEHNQRNCERLFNE